MADACEPPTAPLRVTGRHFPDPPVFTRSIRWRLLVWQFLLLVFILSGFGVTAYQLHRLNSLQQVDAEIESRLADVVGVLRSQLLGPPNRLSGEDPMREPPPGPRRPGPGIGPGRGPGGPGGDHGPRGRGGGGGGGGFEEFMEARMLLLSGGILARLGETGPQDPYYAVWSPTGSLVLQTSNAPPDLARPFGGSARGGVVENRARGLWREAYQFTGPGYCALVGRSVERDLRALRGYAWWLAIAGTTILALGLGGGWVVAGRALSPVGKISRAAGRISEGHLAERIDVTETESELGRLAGILNNTFARLEAAFAQQRQFTADASHELRTPVAVILAEAQTALARERTGPEYRASLEVCQDAAQQMRRLAKALLELARYDAGQESIEREPFDLAECARACADLVLPLARENQLALEVDLTPAKILGDADRLAQVITNLLANAITYNRPSGRISLQLRIEAEHVRLEVSDTGVGIAEADLPRVFERFYRADPSRGRSQGHQGLGLAICKAIVEAHAGSIAVTSRLGVGTTFTVTLPRPNLTDDPDSGRAQTTPS